MTPKKKQNTVTVLTREKEIIDIEVTDPHEEGESEDEKEGILNFNYLKSPGFHHKFLLQDTETQEIYSDNFILHMIELKNWTILQKKNVMNYIAGQS